MKALSLWKVHQGKVNIAYLFALGSETAQIQGVLSGLTMTLV